MNPCMVRWEDGERSVSSIPELLELLDALSAEHSNRPILITVESQSTRDVMTVGVGAARSVVSFCKASLDPPYLSSVGQTDAPNDEFQLFYFFGDWTEISARHLITNSLAREAVVEFATSGSLLPSIRWEED